MLIIRLGDEGETLFFDFKAYFIAKLKIGLYRDDYECNTD